MKILIYTLSNFLHANYFYETLNARNYVCKLIIWGCFYYILRYLSLNNIIYSK